MFTGIVEARGTVQRVERRGSGARVCIMAPGIVDAAMAIGDSVAINGCCLTVVQMARESLEFDAGEETLLRTNLGELAEGTPVNLERAMLPTTRLGGHFVSGHIDCTAKLVRREDDQDWSTFQFQLDPQWTFLMAAKGSVAVDGVSLTIVEVFDDGFSVMLIPHTLEVTNLGSRQEGETVNIETDILAKYVQRVVLGQRDAGQPNL